MRLFLLFVLAIGALCLLDRTYYDALELPVSCSFEEVKEAFRRLTRKYHPDRNPGQRARFEKINNAYQTLYNEGKKYLYDRVGIEKMNDPNVYNEFDFNQLKGPELKIKVFLELKDFYLGKQLDVMIEKQVACPHCKGSGAENTYDIVNCNQCGGKGKVTRRVELGGGYYNLFTQICSRCQGKGTIIGRRCHLCSAQKIIPGIEEFKLKVKPGTASNSELRYANMGDQRLLGAPSDIVFELVQIKHPYFVREYQHLRTTLMISLQEAILGFEKTITHLDGHIVNISSNSITQPGSFRVIEGEGMPFENSAQRGSLIVTFDVYIPNFTPMELKQLEIFFQKKAQSPQ